MNDSAKHPSGLQDGDERAFFDARDERLVAFGDCLAEPDHDVPAIDERYEIRAELGAGGSKIIFEAYDRLGQRLVALAKPRFPNDDRSRAGFLHEARITAALQHPNVMPVYDLAIEPEPFFTMRLGSGLTLHDHLPDQSAYRSLDANLEVFLKVCDAVSHAHAQGIIHLDLKPENIQVGELGDILLSDWGLARRLDESPKADPREIAGTPGFVAPEQTDPRRGVLDERTDVYALGALLYVILCGQAPLSGNDLKPLIPKIQTSYFPLPSQRQSGHPVPPALESVAKRALATKQADRYQDAMAMAQEIERFRGGFATLAENASFGQHLLLLVQRHRTVCTALAIALLAGTLAVTAFVRALQAREATAIAARNQAETARAVAEAAMTEARNQRATTLAVGDLLGDELALGAKASFEAWDFDEAKRRANLAVIAAPNNPIAWREKAFIHFLEQEFTEALAAYANFDSTEDEDLSGLATKYQAVKGKSRRLTGVQLAQLIREIPSDRKVLAYRMLQNNLVRRVPMREHMPAVEAILHHRNPDTKGLQLSWVLAKNTPSELSQLTIVADAPVRDLSPLDGLHTDVFIVRGATGNAQPKLRVGVLDITATPGNHLEILVRNLTELRQIIARNDQSVPPSIQAQNPGVAIIRRDDSPTHKTKD